MPEKYIPPDRSRYLLADEIERLLQAAASMGQLEKQYLTFVANTGVRPSESNAVRGFDVNTKEGFVRIRTLKQKKDIDVFRNIDKKRTASLGALAPEVRCAP